MSKAWERIQNAIAVISGRASIAIDNTDLPKPQETTPAIEQSTLEVTTQKIQPIERTRISSEADRSVFRVTHSASFSCQYCGSGAETFEKAFPESFCPQCGAGAAKCEEKKFIDSFPHLDESFFVVYADDTKVPSEELLADLKKRGAHVVTLEDLMPNGMSTEQVPYVLEQAAVRAPWIIFVPSPQFEEKSEGRDDLILDVVFTQVIRGQKKKIAPAYVSREYMNMAPFLMGGRMGMFLDGDDEQGVAFGKEWFLAQVPKLIEEMKN